MAVIYIIISICIAVSVPSSSALSCDYCDRSNLTASCGDPPVCNNGTALDPCGCCMICAKTENETCGGPWGIYGECADFLVCIPDEEVKEEFGAGGIFELKRPRGRCVTREEYLISTKPCLQELHRFIMTSHTLSLSAGTILGHPSYRCTQKPSCTPEGWYTPIQCDHCKGECWCVDLNGNETPNTRTLSKLYHC